MGIHHIAIMASGTGSNAKAILKHFSGINDIKVSLLLSNKTTSGVAELSKEFDVPYLIFSRSEFQDEKYILDQLQHNKIDFIVLAGFLWLIPNYLVEAFEDRILNIHPSLLPKYGGKGMFGKYVHQAVFNQSEKTSGLTIHLVNQNYDEGLVIFQKEVSISECKSPEEISAEVLKHEHEFYPKIIAQYIHSFKES